jgi:hypothetical protein
MMELRFAIRSTAGRWTLLRCDERGEWHVVRELTEKQAQKLVHTLEG